MSSQPVGMPSKQFLRDLNDYDPMLRVRWDHRDEYWRIERRLRHGKSAVYDMSNPDDRQARSEGYQVAMRVPYDCLDEQVFRAMDAGDIQKRGGYKRVADEMDAHDQAVFAKRRRDYNDELDQRTKSRWTSWNTNYPMTKYGRSYRSRGESIGRG